MSTPSKDTVNADALVAQAALKAAANAAFILDADIVIQEMIDRGKFLVKLPVLKPASMLDIATVYRDLGYGVFYPECSGWNYSTQYYPYSNWYTEYHVCCCKQQCDILISWK